VAASSTLIASADRSGMIRLSRVGTLEPIGQLEAIGASEGVSGLVFAGDDLLLCITGFRTLAVWWLDPLHASWTPFTRVTSTGWRRPLLLAPPASTPSARFYSLRDRLAYQSGASWRSCHWATVPE
jgi:hypothetical protein